MSPEENIFWQWIWWNFFDVPKKILKGCKNFSRFGLYYFSTPILLKTLFSPWRQYSWSYPRGFNVGKYSGVFISNLISRTIGLIIRSSLISLGFFYQALLVVVCLFIFAAWLAFPIIIIFLFYHGLRILF